MASELDSRAYTRPPIPASLRTDADAAQLTRLRQRCKGCGRADPFDFSVPDEVWAAVVPPRLRTHVVCLECFDRFARAGGVDYAPHVERLYFVGAAAVIEFVVTAAAENASLP